jgi:hypothetical protein
MAEIYPQRELKDLEERLRKSEAKIAWLEGEILVLTRRCDRLNQTTVKRKRDQK